MKKKLLITTLFVVSSLYANNFDFEMAPKVSKRVAPNSQSEILSFFDSIKDSKEAVVNISTKKRIKVASNPFENDPFFRHFFDGFFNDANPQNKNRFQGALGSGVIISSDGYIITNYHVIKDSDEIKVTLANEKKEYDAKIVGNDEASDLAVIKIDKKDLKPIKLANVNDVKIGDIVFAIGNPFGIGETVTQGIVSALNKNKMGINKYENFIQTDASINPGNSGGALVDSRGALIGINAAILTRTGGNDGVGFAIPVDMVQNIVGKLIKDGKVIRGYMGVNISDMNKDYEKVYKHKEGAIVTDVLKGSAAQKYDIKRGDLIYEVDGKTIKNAYDLQIIIASFKPSQKVTMKLERDNEEKTINMTLGSRDDDIEITTNDKVLGGLYLSELTKENIYKYRINSDVSGVLVTDVEPRSEAERAGFQSGDIIIAIGSMDIKNLNDLQKALVKYKNIYKKVYVNRYDSNILIVIK